MATGRTSFTQWLDAASGRNHARVDRELLTFTERSSRGALRDRFQEFRILPRVRAVFQHAHAEDRRDEVITGRQSANRGVSRRLGRHATEISGTGIPAFAI